MYEALQAAAQTWDTEVMGGDQTTTVLVVDDDPFVRSALKALIENRPDLRYEGEAEDGVAALSIVRRLRPDVVLIDLQMPRMGGVTAISHISSWSTPPAMVALTNHAEDEHISAVIKAGASGFLTKASPPDVICQGIKAAAAGEWVLSPQLIQRVLERFSHSAEAERRNDPRLQRLTEREMEVAEAVAQGLSNQEIAEKLIVSLSTVKTNVSRILNKLNLTNRVQIALLVHHLGPMSKR